MSSYITCRPVRRRCGLCGRVRLSRSEYAYRQKNGLPVWRCQHRRAEPSFERNLTEALLVIAVLASVTLALWLS